MIGTYKGLEVIQMDVVKVITLTTLYFSVNYLLKFVLVCCCFYYCPMSDRDMAVLGVFVCLLVN